MAFGPDGRHVATCGGESVLRRWDVSRRLVRVLGRHDAKIWSAALDPGGRRLVTAGFDGTARIWHLGGDRPPVVLRGHAGKRLYRAVFSPDGHRVATGAADGTARIWRADGSGEPLVVSGHHGWVYGLAFSPDGRWLATGSKDGEVRLSPVDGAGDARVLQPGCGTRFGGRVESLIFSPRGDRLVADAHGCEHTAALWWTGGERGRVTLSSQRLDHPVLAMSRAGRIATGGRGGRNGMRVWSEDGSGPLVTLPGHDATIHDLTFSRDGRRLLSASFDDSARLWDLDQPHDPLILRGHEDWVNTAAFDAGERRVVTASRDRTARVWRLDEPDRPIVLRGHDDELRFAGFTPEGRVVTASSDGSVRLWSLDEVAADAPALMEQLRRATAVCLTADQRMQYLEEPAVAAGERFAACERAAGRTL